MGKNRRSEEEEALEQERANLRYARVMAGEKVRNDKPGSPHGESIWVFYDDVYGDSD